MSKLILVTVLLLGLILSVSAAQTLNSESAPHSLPKYNLDINVVPETHRLEVKGSARLPADKRTRDNLILALTENATTVEIEVEQPASSAGAVRLERVERPGSIPGLRRWTAIPSQPFPAGLPVLLRFSYSIENIIDSVFYIGPEGSFGSGLNSAWYPQLEDAERFRLRGTGTLQFNVAPGYLAYTAGIRDGTTQNTARPPFRFRIDNPMFFSFAVGKYTVHRRYSAGLPISIYLLRPRPQQQVEPLLEGSARVIRALAQEFGAYPYPEFGVVEIPTEQARKGGSDGASLSGFMLGISSYFDQKFNAAFYGHEIAHTWWGNLIQKKGPRGGYMLDEAMASYGSLRAVELVEGPPAAEQFRRTGYPGYYSEYSGSVYLSRALAGLDHRLSELPSADGFLSRRLANTKGMLVWDMLSRTLKRRRFSRILQDFTRRSALQRVTWDEFLQAIEDEAGEDLKWFYRQWFERTGAPDFQLAWKREGTIVRGTISQPIPYYRARVEVEAIGSDGRRLTRTIEVSGPRTDFTWRTGLPIKSISLDPHFLILRWTPEYRAEAVALLPYTKGDLKLAQGQHDEAYQEFSAGLAQVPEQDRYGLRFMLEYGLAQVLIEQDKIQEAKPHIEAALTSPVRRADTLPWVYVQLAKVARKLNDETTLRRAVDAVKTSDAVAGGRTGAVDEIEQLLRSGKNEL